ncbi:ATP synthase subunit I [Mycobacterium helveticum]|uniref:ATP synthase subunit I n=1 Tax=Mycobacterium helveticum TaxID=2592811 RepID=A0A557WWA5_9MYCO|nr:ATP synthase subunit I [Mycobacterium helveticum]TVS76953.1 ATP synthase subunit I [Mycobacterium helveticum]TVS77546.1 ATP synthase subunit I [Mycobacterium helveticum]
MRALVGVGLLVWLLAWLIRWGWLLLVAAAAGTVLWWFVRWLDRRLDARDGRRAAQAAGLAAIIARADQQHAWTLAGDDRGTYGEYPPHEDFSPEHIDRTERSKAPATGSAGPGGMAELDHE